MATVGGVVNGGCRGFAEQGLLEQRWAKVKSQVSQGEGAGSPGFPRERFYLARIRSTKYSTDTVSQI